MYDGALLSIEAQRARPGTSPEDTAFELRRVRDLLDLGVADLVGPVGVPRHRR